LPPSPDSSNSAIRPHLPPIANGGVTLALPLAAYVLGRLAARTASAIVHQRRTRIEDGRRAHHVARKQIPKDPTCITLAGIAIDPMDETKHFKLIGTTRSGKSTAIREVLRTALSRGDRPSSPIRTAGISNASMIRTAGMRS
jgi:hypothetical protein